MEPRIQYAQTTDGVSIAFSTLGEGMPRVVMPMLPFNHLEKMWQVSMMRRWYDWGTERQKLVRYDNRGSGLSERNVTDFSLEAHLLDLQAVVDRLELERFALIVPLTPGPVAITYAARHPERVSHLVLNSTFARGSELFGSARNQAVQGLIEKDWGLYTETLARYALGWADEELARQYAGVLRECVTQDTALAIYRAIDQFDVSDLLGQVSSPTLVIRMRQLSLLEEGVAQGLASGIPGARLAIVEDLDSAVRAIDEFLGEGEEAAAGAKPLAKEDVHTILFTDVEGSTALTDRLGDAKARDLLREHERMVREALKAHGGSEVKALGDGFMTSFSSTVRALECAIAVQRAFAQRNESAEEPINVRIGLNAGEPIAEGDDLYGTAVNLAARITAQGKGGEILASEAVRQIVAGKKFPFSDLGETTLRGFEDRVHIYQVSWREG